MRLIDADALVESIVKRLGIKSEEYLTTQESVIMSEIYNAPTIEPEPYWILCSERLPKEHEWIGTKELGTTISDKVHITFDVNGERFVKTLSLQNGKLSDSNKKTMDAFYKGWKMLAWMPLPEPYKGADNE